MVMPFVLEVDVQFLENELRTDYKKETRFSTCQLLITRTIDLS